MQIQILKETVLMKNTIVSILFAVASSISLFSGQQRPE